MKILVTRTDRLGDVVLSTSVIRFLRHKYPKAHIAFMVRPENYDVVKNNPDLDEVILYDKYGRHHSLINTLKFARDLRKEKFELAFALHPTNRTHIILFVAGIPMRIGYNRKMGYLLTHRYEHEKQKGDKHEVDYNFDLLKKYGLDIENANRMPYIITGEEEKQKIDSLLKQFIINKKIVAIHAGASCQSKRWPPDRFREVIKILKKHYGVDVVLVGAGETKEYSNIIKQKTDSGIVDLTGSLSIGQLAELLSRCKLFISNDSGPVHMAVAVGTPVISIFGRSDKGLSPKRWGPLGEKDIYLHKNVGCTKCLAHNCDKDFACLKAITPLEVVQAAHRILQK